MSKYSDESLTSGTLQKVTDTNKAKSKSLVKPQLDHIPIDLISIIELLIALVKDLRAELSFQTLFSEDIFPKIIGLIEVTEVELLEQIMTFFSYCFKYMLPILIKNFSMFYKGYYQVINHKNRYVRKYACESFSHILRKIKKENMHKIINKEVLRPFTKPQKYLKLTKSDQMEVDGQSTTLGGQPDWELSVSYEHNEIFQNSEFCQFEKLLLSNLSNTTYTSSDSNTYEFDIKQKQAMLVTISTLFVETIYGVQKKLYTEWPTLIDIMINNIQSATDPGQQAWHVLVLRYVIIQLIPRLEQKAFYELVTYVTQNLKDSKNE